MKTVESFEKFSTKFVDAVVSSYEGASSRVLRDAVRAWGTEEADPRLCLFLFLDHVKLLVQAPLHFTVTLVEQDANKIVSQFSSLSPQDRAFWGRPPLSQEKRDQGKLIAEKKIDEDTIVVILCDTPCRQEILTDTLREILDKGIEELMKVAGTHLQSALRGLVDQKLGYSDPETTRRAPVVEQQLWEDQSNFIRTRLDPILASYGTSDLFSQALHEPLEGSHKWTRLFAVHQHPFTDAHWKGREPVREVVGEREGSRPARYDYTARLFLTPTQVLERKDSIPDVKDHKKLPILGPGDRAIADSPLTSGIIDIGFPSERSPNSEFSRYKREYSNDRNLKEMRKLEDAIYEYDHERESIFYAPIHIGGIPWLALFTFHDRGDTEILDDTCQKTMWARLFIYRDIFPIIAGEVAQALTLAFADSLADAAKDKLDFIGDLEKFATRITRAWKNPSNIFPYGTVGLSTNESENVRELELTLSDKPHTFYLSVIPRESGFSWRQLDPELFSYLLKLQLQSVIDARQEERRKVMGLSIHEWGHRLGDGIKMLRNLRDAAIETEANAKYMAFAYALDQTFRNYVGLPWMSQSRDYGEARYVSRQEGKERDIEILRALFEMHGMIRLLATNAPGRNIRFEFSCNEIEKFNGVKMLTPREFDLLVCIGDKVDEFVKFHGPPWPFGRAARSTLDTQERLLWVLISVPVEILRNAVTHGAAKGITFSIDVSMGQSQIVSKVANLVPGDVDESERLKDIGSKCEELSGTFPFVKCSYCYCEQDRRVIVTCAMKFKGAGHA